MRTKRVTNFAKFLVNDEIKRKEAQEKRRIEEEKRTAKKLRKINEERENLVKMSKQNPKPNQLHGRRRGTLLSTRKEIFSPSRHDSKEGQDPHDRKWIVGDTISPQGSVFNSPGLEKMVRDFETFKIRPKRITESLKKPTYYQKFNSKQFVQNQIEKISEYLGKDFIPDQAKLEKFKRERERKQKIVSRFLQYERKEPKKEYSVVIENLLKEIGSILKTDSINSNLPQTFQVLSPKAKNPELSTEVESPEIKPEKLEKKFQRIFKKFLEQIRQEQNA